LAYMFDISNIFIRYICMYIYMYMYVHISLYIYVFLHFSNTTFDYMSNSVVLNYLTLRMWYK
jgi:hypothetical protein